MRQNSRGQRKCTGGRETVSVSLPTDFYFSVTRRARRGGRQREVLLIQNGVSVKVASVFLQKKDIYRDLPNCIAAQMQFSKFGKIERRFEYGADVSRREKCFFNTLTDTAQSAEFRRMAEFYRL